MGSAARGTEQNGSGRAAGWDPIKHQRSNTGGREISQKVCVVERRSHQPRTVEVSLLRREVERIFSIPNRKCWTVSSVSSAHNNCEQRTSVTTRWRQVTCSVQCPAVGPTGQRVQTMLISDANQKNSESRSPDAGRKSVSGISQWAGLSQWGGDSTPFKVLYCGPR